jgi:ParB/RepB/Spo0J family partition protein
MNYKKIALNNLRPNPFQPRTDFDQEHIEQLAQSIIEVGQLQPILVRETKSKGIYQIAVGENRFRAMKMVAKLEKTKLADTTIDAQIAKLDDQQMFEAAITENVKRRDLTPIEQAQAMRTAADKFELNSNQIAELFGIAAATVRVKMRMTELPENIKTEINQGTITEGAARDLLKVQRILGDEAVKAVVENAQWEHDVKHLNADMTKEAWDDIRKSNYRLWELGTDDERKEHKDWQMDWTPEDKWKTRILKFKPKEMVDWIGDSPILAHALGYDNDKAMAEDCFDVASKNIDELKDMEIGMAHPEFIHAIEAAMALPACDQCPLFKKSGKSNYCTGFGYCHKMKDKAYTGLRKSQLIAELGIPEYSPKKDGEIFGWQQDDYDKMDKDQRKINFRIAEHKYADYERLRRFPITHHNYLKIVAVDKKFDPEKAKEDRTQAKVEAEQREQKNNRELEITDQTAKFLWIHIAPMIAAAHLDLMPEYMIEQIEDELGWRITQYQTWIEAPTAQTESGMKRNRVAWGLLMRWAWDINSHPRNDERGTPIDQYLDKYKDSLKECFNLTLKGIEKTAKDYIKSMEKLTAQAQEDEK